MPTLTGGQLGAAQGRPYLLLDRFSTDAPAPLASPRTCEPGPGTLTVVDTGNKGAIVGGRLVLLPQVSNTNPSYSSTSFSRVVGRALLATLQRETGAIGWGLSANAFPDRASFRAISTVELRITGGVIGLGDTLSTATDYQFASVIRSSGYHILIKGGTEFPRWTLLWTTTDGTNAPLYATITNSTQTGSVDNFAVTDLPAPWTSDYGIATQRLAGARTAGDAFTHTANAVLEWATNRPTASFGTVIFRQQDASNYMQLDAESSGTCRLYQVVNGVQSAQLAAYAGGQPIASSRSVLVFEGSVVRYYISNTLGFTYSSASNFQTATQGRLAQVGTGQTYSEIIAWPRDVSAHMPGESGGRVGIRTGGIL